MHAGRQKANKEFWKRKRNDVTRENETILKNKNKKKEGVNAVYVEGENIWHV